MNMLKQDPKLQFLEMAWSPGDMADLFNRRVLPTVYPGHEVTEVSIDNMIYSPGRRCYVLYSLRGVDPTESGEPSRLALATFAKAKKLQSIYLHDGADNGSRSAGRGSTPVVFMPEYGCLVEFFPMDWQLPSLATATAPREIESFLAHVGVDVGNSSTDRRTEVKVLHYAPHRRCVLQYMMELPEGPMRVVGKLYRTGSEVAQARHIQDRLRPLAKAHGINIPRVLGVVEGLNLLLMEWVNGINMRDHLLETRSVDDAREVARRAAETLAAIHSLHIEGQRMRTLENDLKGIRVRAKRFHLVAPQLARQVDALLDRIALLAGRCTAGTPALIHGDYTPRQMLLNGGQLAVLDFDMTCLGDPAIDVGNFMAQLLKEAVYTGKDYLRQLSSYFLDEYEACSSRDGLAERVRLMQSLACVRLAVRRFRHEPYSYAVEGPQSFPVLMLEEAANCLEEL